MKLKQLVRSTPKPIIKNDGPKIKILEYKLGIKKSTKGKAIKAITINVVKPKAKRRRTWIVCIKPDTKLSEGDIMVYCGCEYYKYYNSFVNFKAGCGIKDSSDGQPPKQTNPTNKKYLCKHLIKLASLVIGKGM